MKVYSNAEICEILKHRKKHRLLFIHKSEYTPEDWKELECIKNGIPYVKPKKGKQPANPEKPIIPKNGKGVKRVLVLSKDGVEIDRFKDVISLHRSDPEKFNYQSIKASLHRGYRYKGMKLFWINI